MWSRTNRLMSHAASHWTFFYDKTKKTASSHLPVERAEVEVMISLTGWEAKCNLKTAGRQLGVNRNTQNHVFIHPMFFLYHFVF